MKLRALALALTLGLAATASADLAPSPSPTPSTLSPAKEKLIRKLLTLTKASDMAMQMMDQMAGQLKPMFPSVPASFWTDFFKEANPDELISKIVPIYGKHLSEEELSQLVKFYETPVGKKLISVQPLIMQESVAVGQVWGRALGEKVMRKLQEKGLLDKNGKPVQK